MAHESTDSIGTLMWYAVQTKPRQEDRAEVNIASLGTETLLPRLQRMADAGRGRRKRIEPLFPGYMFVRCDPAVVFHKIRYTRGVSKILGTPDGPSSIDDAIIDLIRSRIGDDGFVRMTSMLKPGDRVRVTAGPLKNFMGVFDPMTRPSKRIGLLLSVVNGPIRVAIDAAYVDKLAFARESC
jgi:transcriptional antiterminator RfaH